MLTFRLWVIRHAIFGLFMGAKPKPQTMGLIGTLALSVNVIVSLLLSGYREGYAKMRSVWIFSRNDTIGNLAVLAAAVGLFGAGQAPLVASIMAGLTIWGSIEVFTQAWGAGAWLNIRNQQFAAFLAEEHRAAETAVKNGGVERAYYHPKRRWRRVLILKPRYAHQ